MQRKPPLRMETFPLAFMLFLCDELQCWDRIAYGRNSRHELHPLSAEFDFSDNALRVKYFYDITEQKKIDDFMTEYQLWEQKGEAGPPPRLKEYSDMAVKEQRFTQEIRLIVDTAEIPLTVETDLKEADRKAKKIFLSSSNFLHLYDFAVALNGRYSYQGVEKGIPTEQLEAEFESLSLEYQLSNNEQAKSFAGYLNILDCFYTDKLVNYEMLTSFTDEQVQIIAPLEHERWVREKESMYWQKGDAYRSVPLNKLTFRLQGNESEIRKTLREQFRMHEKAMEGHPDEEGDPDRALNQLLELTRKNLSGEQPASAPNPVKNTKKGIGTKQLIIAIAIFFLVINIGLLYFLNKKEAFRKAEEPTEENTSEVYNLSDYAEMLLAEGFTAATGEDIRTLDLFSLKWTIVNQKLYYFSTVNNSPGADDYLCAVLNDNTIQINDYKGPEVKELVIPEIIDGLPVTVIGNSCFKNDKFLEKVTIPDTVDYIDVNAFTGCTALKKLFFKKHHCH